MKNTLFEKILVCARKFYYKNKDHGYVKEDAVVYALEIYAECDDSVYDITTEEYQDLINFI